jgi:hypothetical protein
MMVIYDRDKRIPRYQTTDHMERRRCDELPVRTADLQTNEQPNQPIAGKLTDMRLTGMKLSHLAIILGVGSVILVSLVVMTGGGDPGAVGTTPLRGGCAGL